MNQLIQTIYTDYLINVTKRDKIFHKNIKIIKHMLKSSSMTVSYKK